MNFTKYSSLTNVSEKFINKLVAMGHHDIPYIVNEKIHGANFGVHWDRKNGVRFSKRSGFIKEGEVFYAHTKLVDNLTGKILNLRDTYEECESISVFGEIFGGSFYGDQEIGSKRVQKEVQYSPKTEFMAFDVKLGDTYIDGHGAMCILQLHGFTCPPHLGVFNTLEEALKVANDMESKVPAQLGFTAKEGNIMEGVVIKPAYKDIVLPNGKRLIIKNKNSKFTEKNSEKKVVNIKELSPHAKQLVESLSSYINGNRLSNVVSKEGTLTSKDFGRIMGLFIQDAITDFNEDTESNFKELLDSEYKQALKTINTIARGVLLEDWTDILEDQE